MVPQNFEDPKNAQIMFPLEDVWKPLGAHVLRVQSHLFSLARFGSRKKPIPVDKDSSNIHESPLKLAVEILFRAKKSPLFLVIFTEKKISDHMVSSTGVKSRAYPLVN